MKIRYIALLSVVFLGAGIGAGYGLRCSQEPKNPKVVDETSTETHHVKPPTEKSVVLDDSTPNIKTGAGLCKWYEQCYKYDLTINGSFNKKKTMWFDVWCGDPCKSATKSFKISMPMKEYNNAIGFGPSFLVMYDNPTKKLLPLYGGKISYSRYWRNIGFGPVVGFYGSSDKNMFAFSADVMLYYRW